MIETIEFENYETREQRFRELIFNLLPRKYAGVSTFWLDFTANFNSIAEYEFNKQSYITSTPSDCIAFATPKQTINAAAISAYEAEDRAEETMDKFNLIEIQDQEINTLSGGECVRLALAKAYVFSDLVNKLVISSPFVWLNPESNLYFEYVTTEYNNKNKKIIILTLEGERSNKKIIFSKKFAPILFSISFKNVILNLNPLSELTKEHDNIQGIINDIDIDLNSPCFLKGKNGSGKSIVSMSLSNVMQKSGEATIQTDGKRGFARMMFQDVIAQTLNRDFEKIIYYSGMEKEKVMTIYENLIFQYTTYFKNNKKKVPVFSYDEEIGSKSIIEMKFILAAIRILDKPPLLILDEPGWGMTKISSFAFITSIIEVSHENAVPIIIITNNNWYDNILNDSLIVSKKRNRNSITFTIQKEN
ncbi:MAG: hypothetical protein K9I85_10835 [Saprospiraceae bacterium]|nr:hypothetical protein [Saprospiraceae bacterium]